MCDPVGLKEIAERLDVAPETPGQWLFRGILPPARWIVGGRDAWEWADVAAWAGETGRLPSVSAGHPAAKAVDQ